MSHEILLLLQSWLQHDTVQADIPQVQTVISKGVAGLPILFKAAVNHPA